MSIPYTGNQPKTVGRDAKYSVVYGESCMQIRLVYHLTHLERALLSTTSHPALVEMVNGVKEEHNRAPGGGFHINEHRHVLVPAGGSYYFAGVYEDDVQFEFEGMTIGPCPPIGVGAGDLWPGPHQGIKYVLTGDGRDIKYKVEARPGVEREERLSKVVGAEPAKALALRLDAHKREGSGQSGGGIYINEARHFFGPVGSGVDIEYRYLGPLGDDPWFSPPQVS